MEMTLPTATGPQPPTVEEGPPASPGSVALRRSYDRFVGLLNKRAFGRKRAAKKVGTKGGGSDGNHRWRRSLRVERSEEHTSELQSLMRISYAVICLKKKNTTKQ